MKPVPQPTLAELREKYPFFYSVADPREVAVADLVARLNVTLSNAINAPRERMAPENRLSVERVTNEVEAAFTLAATALRKMPTFQWLSDAGRADMETGMLSVRFGE